MKYNNPIVSKQVPILAMVALLLTVLVPIAACAQDRPPEKPNLDQMQKKI